MNTKCLDYYIYFYSAYFINAKATFGMFGMICFGVDSQAHTNGHLRLFIWSTIRFVLLFSRSLKCGLCQLDQTKHREA
jgi:hypothetical protein